jgi:undecaprenyl pyrophosphate synthase
MTTKLKTTKAIKYSANENLAIETAKAIVAVGTMSLTINENCEKIHKALKGNKLGTVKAGDAVMIRFTETLTELGKAEQTVKNYATAFRKACNEGTAFSMNAYRKPVKKGANTTKSEEESAVVKLTIKKDSTAEQVAEGLRQAVNDTKFRDKYAELAAFMIDMLDEYEGK